ncbi:taurine ABC transporter permease TauC [Paenibacillus sp. JCM 10914]|uniref:ABC transporter permease subunit n=1 Tax=Paenibacillus sp. JCM 10914 TaxID=1236974 RepID=UPI0003CCBBEB|nr:ABC transporter permease subunit [Paenibacillus sp. JCM 10914]GAE08744.1 taurine transport system permease protein TauC [Paenibacillus sp. JCM 10914]
MANVQRSTSSRFDLRNGIYLAVSAISVGLVLLTWWIASSNEWVNPLFLPSPGDVGSAFVTIAREGYKGTSLLAHIGASMQRIAVALMLVFLTAVPLGILCGRIRLLRAIFDPFIEFYRPLPPLAYYSLLVLWFGIQDTSKIILLFLGGFAPMFIAAVYSARRIPIDRINGAKSLGANKLGLYAYVIFPSCLPDLLTGLRTAVGVTYATLVAAEMIAAVSGIGWMVLDASKYLRSDIIYAVIILMGMIAILIDTAIRLLIQRVSPWIEQ